MLFSSFPFSSASFSEAPADNIAYVTGVEATGLVGTVEVPFSAYIMVSGVSGVGEVGTVTVAGGTLVPVTGVEGACTTSCSVVWSPVDTFQISGWTDIPT